MYLKSYARIATFFVSRSIMHTILLSKYVLPSNAQDNLEIRNKLLTKKSAF